MRQGDAGDRLFLVRSGRLRVFVENEEGVRAVRELGAGSTMGELALLTGARRSATVQAIRDTELFELDADVFHALLQHDSELGIAVARALAEQLQASGELLPPPVLPSVVSVKALGPSVDAASFAAQLVEALGRFGSVAALSALDVNGRPRRSARSGRAPARARRRRRPGRRRALELVLRAQADRHVLLAAPGADDPVGPSSGRRRRRRRAAGARQARATPRRVLASRPSPRGARQRAGVGRAHRASARRQGARGRALRAAARAATRTSGRSRHSRRPDSSMDRVGGCSIGAFIGAHARVRHEPRARCASVCRGELVRRSPFNDYTLPRVSLIRSRKAARMLDRVFGDHLVEELPISFFTVSADLLASRTVVHRSRAR